MRTVLLVMLVILFTSSQVEGAISVTFDLTDSSLAESAGGVAHGTSLAFDVIHRELSLEINAKVELIAESGLIVSNPGGTGRLGSRSGFFTDATDIRFTAPIPTVSGGTVTFEGFQSFTLVGDSSPYKFKVTDPTASVSVSNDSVTDPVSVFEFVEPLKTFNLSHVSGAFQVSQVVGRYSINSTGEASAVPEPASAVGFAIAGSLFLIRRRWSQVKCLDDD